MNTIPRSPAIRVWQDFVDQADRQMPKPPYPWHDPHWTPPIHTVRGTGRTTRMLYAVVRDSLAQSLSRSAYPASDYKQFDLIVVARHKEHLRAIRREITELARLAEMQVREEPRYLAVNDVRIYFELPADEPDDLPDFGRSYAVSMLYYIDHYVHESRP